MRQDDDILFDDRRRPTPTVGPDIYFDEKEVQVADERRLRREVVVRLLEVLVAGATTPAQIGRRAALLAYLLRLEFAPARSVRALGRFFGVSSTRAHQTLTRVRKELRALLTDNRQTP